MATPTERAAFNWDDPFLLDDQLTEDERMIRDTARAYAQEKLRRASIEAYLEEKTDRAIFNEMGELGLLGVDDAGGIWRRRRQLRLPMGWWRARSSASIPAIAR